jgi:hypothetical protein
MIARRNCCCLICYFWIRLSTLELLHIIFRNYSRSDSLRWRMNQQMKQNELAIQKLLGPWGSNWQAPYEASSGPRKSPIPRKTEERWLIMLLILVVDGSDSENIHTYSATYYKILHTDTQHRRIETFAVQANHSSA